MMSLNMLVESEIDAETMRAEVKGIIWNGEYDVDIIFYRNSQYSWRAVDRLHVTCKRISTIYKKLETRGFKKEDVITKVKIIN